MRIAVAGAGAMGSRFGWTLRHAGNDVVLIDSWNENIQEVRKNGVSAEIDGKTSTEQMSIFSPEEIKDNNLSVDLIIILTKSMGLADMLANIQPIIGKNTYVLCLINGLGHVDTLKEYVDEDHIIMGVTMVATNMLGPGRIKFEGGGATEIQPLNENGQKEVEQIISTFQSAGLETRYSENVIYYMWRKACLNGVLNPTDALLETNNVGFAKGPDAKALTQSIVDEFISVAKKEGITLDREEILNHIEEAFSVPHYPSMYQDLIKNHRLTEIDYINGAVWKKGQKYGVATPYNACITVLVHTKEVLMNAK